jgi:pimeloyl-ACP methyl ester carboxylesterase
VADIDVAGLLAEVRAPTLVMHVRGDARVPIEAGRRLAAGIPGARFMAMPGRNHILLEGEPALERFLEETRLFLTQ